MNDTSMGWGLRPRQPDQPPPHHWPVAGFLVDDIYDAAAELRSAGVEVLPEPEVDDQRQRRVHDSMLLPGWLARRS